MDEEQIKRTAREEARMALGLPITHIARSENIDKPWEPFDVISAFPVEDNSVLTEVERAAVDKFIEQLPDKNDPAEINYWFGINHRQLYLEGWADECLAGTGFPDIGGGDWEKKIDFMVEMTEKTLPEKAKEKGLRLVEGGFREFPGGDREYLYGVTWGVYE